MGTKITFEINTQMFKGWTQLVNISYKGVGYWELWWYIFHAGADNFV